MSNLSVFFKQNKPVKKNEFFAASKDFVDADGKPVMWEFKRINSREKDEIQNACSEIKDRSGKMKVDSAKFGRMFLAQTVVFPDLRDRELVDSYMSEYPLDERTPDNLICLLLDDPAEYEAALKFSMELSGVFKKNDAAGASDGKDENIETAKN